MKVPSILNSVYLQDITAADVPVSISWNRIINIAFRDYPRISWYQNWMFVWKLLDYLRIWTGFPEIKWK